ncbi:hypothetical protein DFJ43DRAFT_1150531 [Lentinula guzmanii]|uniref:Uncharacterized protein n=1 Tax=Lentinula guzmanii TaxID=2804957 RepID=A0AA38N3P1_9AGAR|nr:hypothetical protein DFJ43DRAFT_1150531 [Lentinula guzmanii]
MLIILFSFLRDFLASIYSSANNSGFNSPAGILAHQQLPSLSPHPPHLVYNNNNNNNNNDFPLPNTPSPPSSSAGIRLPNAPLSDIAEYRNHSTGEYDSNEYTQYNSNDASELSGYPESYSGSYNASPYLTNHAHLPASISPSPHPDTPHSLPLPLSSTNSPYLGSSHLASPPHLGSPHLGSPGTMIPASLLEAPVSAGSSNGSTNTLMDMDTYPGSPETLIRPARPPVGGPRNKSHTISTSTPYEAYLNASREIRGQEQQQRDPRMLYPTRERSGSVSSVYSTNSSASSTRSTHSSRASSILHSARSVHAPLPEVGGEGCDLVVGVSGSMSEMHMTLDPSVLNGERV